ncbi:MAG: N-acyl homoserine lactonase family protein [Alphaproteobacteria bacterium]|nr:N-acyl homoserine lactonase family protein [Alphaproteobacteria bacterium]
MPDAATAADIWEAYAARYAVHTGRRRHEHMLAPGDAHDAPMPISYYVWALRNTATGRVIVVDTGFTADKARARGQTYHRTPAEALRLIGIEPGTVEEVILTHLHYDHVGGFAWFPRARFHLQDREMAVATGRHMRHPIMRKSYEVEDILAIVRRNYAERVRFHDGDGRIAPGVSVHHVGGHAAGLQVVRVKTARGALVLAADATHFYENMRARIPFPIIFSLADMLEAFDRLRALADGPDLIVPGHDPLVLSVYPPAAPGLEDIAVRLDATPVRPSPLAEDDTAGPWPMGPERF